MDEGVGVRAGVGALILSSKGGRYSWVSMSAWMRININSVKCRGVHWLDKKLIRQHISTMHRVHVLDMYICTYPCIFF